MAQISITGQELDTVTNWTNTFVQIKDNWGSNWRTVSYLEAISATITVSPNMPSAKLLYRYGEIKREDQTIFRQYDPLSITNSYVRIMGIYSDGSVPLWVGIITDDSFEMQGAIADPQGDQTITTYGLEHLLDRVAIVGAYTDEGQIDWSPVFNEPEWFGGKLQGNRSTAFDDDGGSYLFSRDREKWNNVQIIEYLLASYVGLPIQITGQYEILEQLYGSYYFEGLTIKQAIDKLVDRRRGIGWFLNTDGGGNISLEIFSVFNYPVTAGSITFPGNNNQQSLDLGDAIDVLGNTTHISQSTLYDRIIVQGARTKVCFTVSIEDGNLEPDWSDEDETEYKELTGTAEENDKARASEKYEAIYQRFCIPKDWDYKVDLGDGEGTKIPILDPENSASNWSYPRPLMRWIPIEKQGSLIAEYEETMVFIKDGEAYYLVDKLPAIKRPGAHVRTLDSDKGFAIKSKINHLFGLNHFHFDSGNTGTEPVYDYKTLMATVAMETDTRNQVVVLVGSETEIERTLVVDVHDAELWQIVPGTVTGVNEGELVRATDTVTVRDDTDKLEAIAALAKAWYSDYRAAVSIEVKKVCFLSGIGSIITEIESAWQREPVNTVVTSRHWDFRQGTTTIETGYMDLDVRAMLDIPGMSDFRAVGRAFNRQQKEIGDLKARVGTLPARLTTPSGQESTQAVTPTVDFIVDMFDRADSDGIGDYWTNTNKFAIRNGKAYENGSDSYQSFSYAHAYGKSSCSRSGATVASMVYNESSTPDVNRTARSRGGGTWYGLTICLYKAILSGADFNIKIQFNTVRDFSGWCAYGKIAAVGRVPDKLRSKGNRVQIEMAKVPSLSVGSQSAQCSCSIPSNPPTLTGGSGSTSASIDGHTTPAYDFMAAIIRSNDGSVLNWPIFPEAIENDKQFEVNWDEFQWINNGHIHFCSLRASAEVGWGEPTTGLNWGVIDGENIMEIRFRGDRIAAYLNGNQIFSDAQAYTIDNGLVGLGSNFPYLSALLSADNTDRHITSFKAWNEDIPEPPDESGRGTYTPPVTPGGEGSWKYTDKYHTTNAETGVTTYNPNA